MLTLRPYQRESINSSYTHWLDGGGDGLIVIPTGGGKSLIIAQLLQELLHDYPLMRICVITHSKELIEQNHAELVKIWPSAPAGIFSASVGRRDTQHPIIFCGIQSVYDKVEKLGKFDLVLIDEAHLISRKASSMYGKFFADLRKTYPDMRLLGLTATPYRLDSGRLDTGDDAMFEKIIYEADVADLIEQGYLSPLVSKGTKAEISTKGVHRRGGEFIAGELERAAMAGDLVKRAAAEIAQRGADRKAWLCFCSGIDHAIAVRDALRDLGITAEEIDGNTPKKERERLIANFRAGAIKALTSVNVLSIGFNVPHVDLIALLRPTESPGLYIQQVGRGFRKAPGKKNCLILDFAGNVMRHGPVDMVVTKDKKKAVGAGEAPVKECPDCQAYVPISVMECPHCKYHWERDPEPKHHDRPMDVDILSNSKAIKMLTLSMIATGWDAVRYVTPSIHMKIGKPPTLKLTYTLSDRKKVSQWVCFSHPKGTFPRNNAERFWLRAGGGRNIPENTQQAMARFSELKKPMIVKVGTENGFTVVQAVEYEKAEVAA
jgi:DNA repair protein RadD